MGAFQANILEAMKSLREDFQKSLQKSTQVEVDQTSALTSKSDPSKTNLDPLSTNVPESMDVDYGLALPPRLDSHDSRIDYASGLPLSAAEEPSRLPSTPTKKSSHHHRQYAVASSSASDHYSEQSEDSLPRAGLKSTLTSRNINPGPDMYLLWRRRTSPLEFDIGPVNLQRGLIPIRIIQT